MLDLLKEAEREIPSLLKNRDAWHGLHIDYEHPHVDRLWLRWKEDMRLNLHRIYPCSPEQAFMHPHPCPSAMIVVGGRYEMKIGNDPNGIIASTIVLTDGARYEMITPSAYHSVRPLDYPVLSVMVTGKPWSQEESLVKKVPQKEQRPLDDEERNAMFRIFNGRMGYYR